MKEKENSLVGLSSILVTKSFPALLRQPRTFIESLGIDFQRIRERGYDGASAMSGVHSRVQTLIKETITFPASFVH